MSNEQVYQFSCRKCGKEFFVGEGDQKMHQHCFVRNYYALCPHCNCLNDWDNGTFIGFADEPNEDIISSRRKSRVQRKLFLREIDYRVNHPSLKGRGLE